MSRALDSTNDSAGSSTGRSRASSSDGGGRAASRSARKEGRKAAKPLPVPRPEQLVDKLLSVAGPGCSRRIEVPLTAVATGVVALGSGPLAGVFLGHLAHTDHRKVAADVRGFWQQMVACSPFLSGHINALLGWLDDGRDPDRLADDVAAFQRCADVLANTDLRAVAEQTLVDGELLGPVYTLLRSEGSRRASGAFFTPMTVCTLLAQISSLGEGESFAEPCSGAGAMAVAVAREMRRRSLDPTTVRWTLNDLDPIAVALSGINAVVHGLGQHVTLRCGNGLTLGLDEPTAS